MRRDSSREGGKFGPRGEAKSLGAGSAPDKKGRGSHHALLAREYHYNEVCGVSFGISVPEFHVRSDALKLVKRQMYGRGKLDLLQARVIGAR
jgi:hypothetical protein